MIGGSYYSVFPAVQASVARAKCKRAMDIGVTLAAIFVLAPLIIGVYLLVRATSRGPAIYKQRRVGYGGRYFSCLKFRTMAIDADVLLRDLLERSPEAREEWETNFKLKNDPRITPVGLFLRQTSLDELPQLFNILTGDMSLVGPRPIVPDEMNRYGSVLPLYLSVRPGLTGLWQTSGRSDCTYPERVALDEQYIRNFRLRNDAKIIFRTFVVVMNRRGSY